MRSSDVKMLCLVAVSWTNLACWKAEPDDRRGGGERVRLAATTNDQKCDDECFQVCAGATECQHLCYLKEQQDEEIYCRPTTCFASGLPCNPGSETGGSGGNEGGGGAGGGGGACGPQLCSANLNLGKLVGQKVDWKVEDRRRFRAVYDYYAYPQAIDFPGCDLECCDYYRSIRVFRCAGRLANGDWGAGAGIRVCHPEAGQDQSLCTD